MTLNKLIRSLEAIKRKHGGRVPVCANTQALRQTCNDVWQIVDISQIETKSIEQVDGDGFTKYRKDGYVSERKCVVLA